MATARDVTLFGAILFVLAMGLFVIYFGVQTVVTQLVAIPIINATEPARTAFNDITTTLNRFDYVIFGFFIALILSIMVSSWFVGGEPIFIFFYFLVTVVGVLFSMVLANVWHEFVSNVTIFGSTINAFPITNNILTYLPIYVTVVGVLGVIIMFSKPYITQQL